MKKPTPITRRLNTTGLIEVVAADLGCKPDDVRDTVMATFTAIARAAASGHDVAITNFGTWLSYQKARRKARNPQTGGTVTVPSHRGVRFRVSPNLAAAVSRKDRKVTIRKAPKGSNGSRASEK
ncbi:HU family DNA-binding protein [Streptomyces sp. NPDC091281]|uniref:HU family DNA-binding protein n=1 Tax=Streptomyces sp. NPDC091281 TaxID=3365985 RepID=UPI003825AAA0